MHSTTPAPPLLLFSPAGLPSDPIIFSLTALQARLGQVEDKRARRGRHYALPVLLTIAVLAKLCGQSQPRALAEWARLRTPELSRLFALKREEMPHPSTWSRILGHALDPVAFAQLVSQFLAETCMHPVPPAGPERGQVVLALDGKSLRGTIALGQTSGVHLLAAYLPDQGVVVAQLALGGTGEKGHEISTAPQVLAQVDLRGLVITGDAMFAQREVSRQVLADGGDYLWIVKRNQPELSTDIQTLFTPEVPLPGCSAMPLDFTTAQTVERGHGRWEKRVITVSSLLTSYSTWPGLQQVFCLERWTTDRLGKTTTAVRYGITSLPAEVADAACLLGQARAHWGIENGLHYRRDERLREDRSQIRMGCAPQVLATLNNLVLGLLALHGVTNVAQAQRAFDYHFHKALGRLKG